MAKRRKPGAPKGVMPKNYAQFREAGKATHFAPGYRGQSIRQIAETQHLKDWLTEYDNRLSDPSAEKIIEHTPSIVSYDCPPSNTEDKLVKQIQTHAERVRDMLAELKPDRERMLDNDPVSIIRRHLNAR